MRKILIGLTLLGAVAIGGAAQAAARSATLPVEPPARVQQVNWYGYDYCGRRCQEHRWREHERWEARRRWHEHRRWEERRYGYYGYPRY